MQLTRPVFSAVLIFDSDNIIKSIPLRFHVEISLYMKKNSRV